MMKNVLVGLVSLSALAFVLAVISSVFDPQVLNFVSAEGFSGA